MYVHMYIYMCVCVCARKYLNIEVMQPGACTGPKRIIIPHEQVDVSAYMHVCIYIYVQSHLFDVKLVFTRADICIYIGHTYVLLTFMYLYPARASGTEPGSGYPERRTLQRILRKPFEQPHMSRKRPCVCVCVCMRMCMIYYLQCTRIYACIAHGLCTYIYTHIHARVHS